MYKCYVCGKQFRGRNRINQENFWCEYLENKQTYKDIGIRYGVSESTVKRKIRLITEEWQPDIPHRKGFFAFRYNLFWTQLGCFSGYGGSNRSCSASEIYFTRTFNRLHRVCFSN